MVKIIVPPAIEPISLAEFEKHCNLDSTADVIETAFRSRLITTAREYCESYQRRAYITQTLELSLNVFPKGAIELPRGNVQSVTSVKYRNAQEIEHTLIANTDYIISTRGVLGRIAPAYGKSWPSQALSPLDPISIEYVCGYGNTKDEVPLRVQQAILMLSSYWYDNRSAVLIGNISKELEFSVKSLLNLDRIKV